MREKLVYLSSISFLPHRLRINPVLIRSYYCPNTDLNAVFYMLRKRRVPTLHVIYYMGHDCTLHCTHVDFKLWEQSRLILANIRSEACHYTCVIVGDTNV